MKIFLGYPSENLSEAEQVFNVLSSIDYTKVWFDKSSLVGGADWDRERSLAQKQADLIVHIYSNSASSRSGVVNREIHQSLELADDQPIGSNFIIPIRVGRAALPGELMKYQYIELSDGWQEKLTIAVDFRHQQLMMRAGMNSNSDATTPTTTTISTNLEPEVKVTLLSEDEPHYRCAGEYPQFGRTGLYFDFVNSSIKSDFLDNYFQFMAFAQSEDNSPAVRMHDERPAEWEGKYRVEYRSGNLISINALQYIDYGGIHPNYYVRTLNFFGERLGRLSAQDLLCHDDQAARKVLEYCNQVACAEHQAWRTGDEGALPDFIGFLEKEEDVWKFLKNFNFHRRGVTFHLAPSELLPHAFGFADFDVPWRFLDEFVNAEVLASVNDLE
ncbi:MAG: TIR domain-containing protein [Hyphomicrobiales bacterium]